MTPVAAPGPVLLLLLFMVTGGVLRPHRSPQQDYYDEDDGPSPADNGDGHDDYEDHGNGTEALGSTLGGPCSNSCSDSLLHVHCSARTQRCECEDHFPVEVGPTRGCTTPVGLGEQCLYQAACQHWDQHARCTQVEHNAVCQCEPGFHTVPVHRAGRRTFCSEDLVLLTADLPTLLGVTTGIALFTGAICFVLRLFVGGRPRDHFANANLAPSHILFSSDTGSEMSLRQLTAGKMALSLCRAGRAGRAGRAAPSRLPLSGRSASCTGSQRSMGSLSRGLQGAGSSGAHPTTPDQTDRDQGDEDGDGDGDEDEDRPPPVPTSTPPPLTPMEPGPAPTPSPPHAPTSPAPDGSRSTSPSHQASPPRTRAGRDAGSGSRRQSLSSVHSVHSTASSAKSFGVRRFEREREQRLQRQQLAASQQQLQQLQTPGSACSACSACSASGDELSRGVSPSPSPNPLSPMSTDKLLPALDQLVEDVVWTTQSSSQRQDHHLPGPSSGYRPGRSERARHLQQLHLAMQRASSASSASSSAAGTSASPDGR